MVGEGGEEIFDRRAIDRPGGLVPTGSDTESEGSSVEIEEEPVSPEQLPSTAEIIEAEGGPPEEGLPPEEEEALLREGILEFEPSEEPTGPHDKGRMADIE